MIAAEPQGFLKDNANIARLGRLGGVSRAGYYRQFGPHPPKRARTRTCAISSSASYWKTAITAIAELPKNSCEWG